MAIIEIGILSVCLTVLVIILAYIWKGNQKMEKAILASQERLMAGQERLEEGQKGDSPDTKGPYRDVSCPDKDIGED